ncbi:hypothetical protein G6676_01785 [Polynucleobacter paneuropaeus]|nr:hypothetical protein G6676_01785 [Polynucleobacter paneuropaeus]
MRLKIIVNAYIVIYFIFATLASYLAIFTKIKIPFIIELIPLLILPILNNFNFKIKYSDFLFLILSISCVIFLAINISDNNWIGNVEIRGIFSIAMNYWLFRIIFLNYKTKEVKDTIVQVLKYSMYFMIFEFIVINIGNNSSIIENSFLSVFPERDRLYDSILGFVKPNGIYPGTHNASIAASLSFVYLVASKTVKNNYHYFVAALLVFLICFSVTGLVISLVVASTVYLMRQYKSIKNILFDVFLLVFISLVLYFVFTNYDAITVYRSSGTFAFGQKSDLGNSIYLISIEEGINNIVNNPFGTPMAMLDFKDNEVYLSRLISYFGISACLFLFLSIIYIIGKLKSKESGVLFFSLAYLILLLSSLHYPAMVSIPLGILIPIGFAYIAANEN